jgi:uncharacterized membrane protein YgcG
MLQLNKGLIKPTRVVEASFETVKAKAFKGSDYEHAAGKADSSSATDTSSAAQLEEVPEFLDYFVGFGMLALFILPLVLIIYFLVRKVKRKRKIYTLYKNADYFREAPIEGNLEASYVLASDFKLTNNDGNLIGSAFLMLINAGCLEPISEKTVGFFGKEKESISIKLVHPPEFSGVTVNMLYNILVLASGSDQVLQERELETYCRKNHTVMTNLISAAKQDGKSTLVQINSYDFSKKAKLLGLSQHGENLLLNIMGLKKYLLEFSLIEERTIAESIIWQDYLTFAALLGIADRVIKQFEKVYPNATEYSENAHYYYMLSRRYTKASYETAQAARSAGSGGRSSFGGGGGFSGGGHGGGTR